MWQLVRVNLVNSSSSSLKRLQIPFDLWNKVEEREAIYKSGSKAKRGRTASSLLIIQASLDYPRNSRPWKSRLLRNLGNRYAIPTFPQPYCCGYF
jgi:hypothetical protein